MASSQKIITYNVRGINSPQKRGRLWYEMCHQSADIIYMQEKHLMSESVPRLPSSPYNQCFHAFTHIARARGVTIAFGKTCPIIPTAVQKYPAGRFLFIKGMLYGQCYTFASIYDPNSCIVEFLMKTMVMLNKFGEKFVILRGDFNIIMDPKLDTTAGKTALLFKALKHVKKLLRAHHLVDSWQALNKGRRDYSYYSKTHKVYSRLDLFFVGQYYLKHVNAVTIESITISDHAPVVMTFVPVSAGQWERTWQLNESLLDDKQIAEDIRAKMIEYFEINTPGKV